MFNRKEYARNYHKKHREERKKYMRENYRKKIEQRKKYKKEYNKRPEVIKRRRERERERYGGNLQRTLYLKLLTQIRRCIKRKIKTGKINIRDFTKFYYIELYGLDLDKLIESFEPLPKSLEELKKYDIDHIIPVCKFDLSKKEDIKKAFNTKNLRLIKKSDNRKKREKLIAIKN